MPETKRDVNIETEVVRIPGISDVSETDSTETDIDDDLDEEVVPPQEVPPTDEPDPDAPVSSPEEEPTQPAPVSGETPREYALRKEVERLRKDLRGNAIQGISAPKASPQANNRLAKLREKYTDDEIQNMREAIGALAEAEGYVKAEHTYQQAVNDILESFLEENKEYLPQNDPGDVRWGRFKSILESGIYNLQGKTPKELRAIYARAHRDVTEELGDAAQTVQARTRAAQQQKIQSVSHAGGTRSTTPKPKATPLDPSIRDVFKGFDDEDFA